MKNNRKKPDLMKRKLLALFASVPWFAACSATGGNVSMAPEDVRLREKFRGIHGGVLYFDASGYSKDYVTMQTQSGQMWHATFRISWGAQQSTFTDSMYIPKTIRVIWRMGDVREGRFETKNEGWVRSYSRAGFEGGTILGDYTVPLATRIPDEVLDYIRANGGALRLKIRLKDDGVLIGWDVEKIVPLKEWKPGLGLHSGVNYLMPGGDFREAQILNGKVIDPGWQK